MSYIITVSPCKPFFQVELGGPWIPSLPISYPTTRQELGGNRSPLEACGAPRRGRSSLVPPLGSSPTRWAAPRPPLCLRRLRGRPLPAPSLWRPHYSRAPSRRRAGWGPPRRMLGVLRTADSSPSRFGSSQPRFYPTIVYHYVVCLDLDFVWKSVLLFPSNVIAIITVLFILSCVRGVDYLPAMPCGIRKWVVQFEYNRCWF